MKNTTLVIGASTNPSRYSYKAVMLLQEYAIPHIALGLKTGKIGATAIGTERIIFNNIDTVSLYIGEKHQDSALIKYLISLSPRRVIFNPGAESVRTIQALKNERIQTELACTLVLLKTSQYV